MTLPVIAITNASTCLSDLEVAAAIPSLQRQVSQDFRAFWNIDCSLTFLGRAKNLTVGWWQLVVSDNPDQAGALGYHELTSRGTPLGKVFAGLDIQNGSSWTATLSHELLEMLADPWLNWCAQGTNGEIYALEVCDAVEADELGYEIDGVLLSDFITPSWFEPTECDRVDFKGRIKRAFELGPGGYISTLNAEKGWTQVTARGGGVKPIPGAGGIAGSLQKRRGGIVKSEVGPAAANTIFCASARLL